MERKPLHNRVSAEPESRQQDRGGFTLIREEGRIAQFLRNVLEEETLLEVQINDRTRIFFTYLQDHPPAPSVDAEGNTVDPPPYTPLSYLKAKDHLIVVPLDPPVGNAQIRTSERVTLRFFKGVKAIESDVTFMNIESIGKKPVIKLSFPKEMRQYRKRRYFRAQVAQPWLYMVNIRIGRDTPVEVRMLDISAGGMAFCNPLAGQLVPGDELIATIQSTMPDPARPNDPPPILQLKSFVRNVGQPAPKDGCEPRNERCGIQFDLVDEHLAMDVESMVASVQRIYLQEMTEKKTSVKKTSGSPACRMPPPHESEAPGNLSSKLGAFLGLKK